MASAKTPKPDVSKLCKEWKDGQRTQSSVIDELYAAGFSVSAIAKVVDRPYRQVFNTVNRKEYGKRPSERTR